jgi:hypothetical protein
MTIRRTTKQIGIVIGSAALVTAGAVGGASAIAGADDDERPVPASDREQAERAALEETGGGEVTGTEVDDEESTYEVEVTLDDGTQVDVQLDDAFRVVGTEADGADEPDEPDEPDDE